MDITKDLAAVTTMSPASVQKFLSKFQDCLCYALQEMLTEKESSIELDIFIGKLAIELIDDRVLYKFTPTSSFEKDISDTILNGVCPMLTKVENSIQGKIMKAYKELY